MQCSSWLRWLMPWGFLQMQALGTSDYRGYHWPSQADDEDEGYPLYVVMLMLGSYSLADEFALARSL